MTNSKTWPVVVRHRYAAASYITGLPEQDWSPALCEWVQVGPSGDDEFDQLAQMFADFERGGFDDAQRAQAAVSKRAFVDGSNK